MRVRWVFLVGVTATALVGGLGLLVGQWAGATRAEMPGWIEATATTAAVGAAVAAAIPVTRAVQMELTNERIRLDLAQKSQAVLLSAWPTATRWRAEREDQRAAEVDVVARNASPAPVTSASVSVAVRVPGLGAPMLGEADLGLLPPGEQRELTVTVRPQHPPEPGEVPDWESPGEARVTLDFVDSAGFMWWRDEGGVHVYQ